MIKDTKALLRISTSGLFKFLRFSPRLVALPTVCIYPTSNCNSDCFMCDNRKSNRNHREQMELSVIEKLIGECSELRFKPHLHFAGLGEPLMYRDFERVAALCKKAFLSWTITTNGLNLKQNARSIVENNCRGINLSVHGTRREHQRITNTPGGYEEIVEGLRHLDRIKQETGSENPLVTINCVVNSVNIFSLQEMCIEFSKMPINSITIQHLSFSRKQLDTEDSCTMTNSEEISFLDDFIRNIGSQKLSIPTRSFPTIKKNQLKRYYTDASFPESKLCCLPWLSVRIYPNGDVKMCDVLFGNIRERTLKELINNDRAMSFRKDVRDGRFDSPMCFRCCHRKY